MKKNIIFATILALSTAFFVSCDKGDNGSTPTPTPTPSANPTLRLDMESASDLLKMIDFTGSEFKIGSQTIDLSSGNFDKTYNITETTKGSLKIVAKPKDFTPAAGQKYDAVCLIEITFNKVPCVRNRLGAKGFCYDNELTKEKPRTMQEILQGWCNRLSADYTFTVNPDGTITDFGR